MTEDEYTFWVDILDDYKMMQLNGPPEVRGISNKGISGKH